MYCERTARSIFHSKQIKQSVGKALLSYAFNYTKSLTYITAYAVKTVRNLCQTLKKKQQFQSWQKMVLQDGFVFVFFKSASIL